MNKIVLACVASVAGFSSALAADLPSNRPVPPPLMLQNSWTGFYLGVQASYLSGTTPIRDCVGLCVTNHRLQKGYAAINGGYDWQLSNNLVFGLTGWVAVTPIRDTVTLAPGIDVVGRSDFGGFAGLRLGYAVGNFLPYVVAGVEAVSGKVTIAIAPTPVNRRTHVGYGVGAGVEFRLAQNWSADARYMYSDLGFERYNFGGGATRGGFRGHTVSLGINYRFGGAAVPVMASY